MHTATLRPQTTARRPYAALVVSGDPVRRGSMAALAEQSGAASILPAQTGSEALRIAADHAETDNDLCLIDGSLTDTPVLSLVRTLRLLGWHRVLLVTARHDVVGVYAALSAGIAGYVVAHPTSLPAPGGPGITELTEREIQVLQAASEGMSNKAIGHYLGLSSLTVKSHMARIGRKLGTGDRAALVAIAMRAGIIE